MRLDEATPLSIQPHPFFGPSEDGWNIDLDGEHAGYGKPGVGMVANAISVWSALQQSAVTLGDAAQAFKMPVEAVAQCVDHHPWMYLVGDETTPIEHIKIEHEGE